MSSNPFQTSIKTVLDALKPLAAIPRPYGDNEGYPINSNIVFPYLTPEQKQLVRYAEEILYAYTRDPSGEVNRRSITTLNNHGYYASLNADQYEITRLVGNVSGIGQWTLDISDPSNGRDDG